MSIFALPLWAAVYCLVLCAALGLVMGSALHCLAWRTAHGKAWAAGGRSACPACGHTLAAADLVPLFSWLRQKGKCRYCAAPIPARYPLAEGILAVVYVSVVLRFGLSGQTVQYLVLCSCLFCLSWVDWDTQTIPNRFLVIAAAARFVYLAATAGAPAAFLAQSLSALAHGVGLGGGVLLLALLLDKLLGKESMGGGDIKLLAVLGLYFTLPCCLFLVVAACLLGIGAALALGAKGGVAFPFGPALSAAAWLTLLVGQPVAQWYMGLF